MCVVVASSRQDLLASKRGNRMSFTEYHVVITKRMRMKGISASRVQTLPLLECVNSHPQSSNRQVWGQSRGRERRPHGRQRWKFLPRGRFVCNNINNGVQGDDKVRRFPRNSVPHRERKIHASKVSTATAGCISWRTALL